MQDITNSPALITAFPRQWWKFDFLCAAVGVHEAALTRGLMSDGIDLFRAICRYHWPLRGRFWATRTSTPWQILSTCSLKGRTSCQDRRSNVMSSPFSSHELRAAARQATTLALSSWCPKLRKNLLETAEKLAAEADATERSRRKAAPDSSARPSSRVH
jgi:hypothetical protein